MSLSSFISRPGFLLLEVIIACAVMSIIALSIAQYHWHMHVQNIQINKHINVLLDAYTFFEKRQYQLEPSEHIECEKGEITWQKLPIIKKDGVIMQPIRVELSYVVAGKKYISKLVSVA